jgi:hypothetical protein
MKRLSEQLSDLSARVKQTEDVVDATRARNRAELESQRAALREAVDGAATRASTRAAEVKADVDSRWQELRDALDARFASIRVNLDERRFERDLKRAERRADAVEQDAVDAVEFALYVLDQAESAVVEAALARADADELSLGR